MIDLTRLDKLVEDIGGKLTQICNPPTSGTVPYNLRGLNLINDLEYTIMEVRVFLAETRAAAAAASLKAQCSPLVTWSPK